LHSDASKIQLDTCGIKVPSLLNHFIQLSVKPEQPLYYSNRNCFNIENWVLQQLVQHCSVTAGDELQLNHIQLGIDTPIFRLVSVRKVAEIGTTITIATVDNIKPLQRFALA